MKHRGVLIQKVKEEIPGSSLKELKDGCFVECKPQFDITFQFARSFPYSTLGECKQAIDDIYERCKEVGGETDPVKFAEIMNSGDRLPPLPIK